MPEASILLVDNEPAVRDMLAAILRLEGYRVRTTATGADALALADAVQPDIVLLDVHMPGMDGYAVLDQLLQRRPGVPVLLMSGSPDLDRARAAGASAFLEKPYHPAEVLEEVARLLSGGEPVPATMPAWPTETGTHQTS